jgi:Holliday junction resolvasome RuvABC endonuclease subunit
MRYCSTKIRRVLAIDPSTSGFSFAVMEGPEELIDWGIKAVKGDKNRESLKRVIQLIERYHPDVIVVEDYQHKSSRRSRRVRHLLKAIVAFASRKNLRVRRVSRSAVKKALPQDGSPTKHQIASELAHRFPELVPRLPRVRKPWMSEDPRMSIFDSVALALTSFYS